MTREQLGAKIVEVALLRGKFILRSGRESDVYFDKYLFETNPEVLRAIGKMIAERITPDIDRLAGPELGAVALAAAASMESGRPFVLVRNKRKDYGTGKQIEGVLKEGERVLLIEDIVTSGGQVIESVKTLRDAGAVVERVIVVIDRMEGARATIEAANVRLDALFNTKDLGI